MSALIKWWEGKALGGWVVLKGETLKLPLPFSTALDSLQLIALYVTPSQLMVTVLKLKLRYFESHLQKSEHHSFEIFPTDSKSILTVIN